MNRTVLAFIFAAIALTSCSPKLRFKPGEMPTAVTPPAQLKSQAEGYVTAHINEGNYDEIRSGPDYRRLIRIIDRLTIGAGYAPKTFPVHLVNAGSEVNAAAFNGAAIVVYKELMNRVATDEGIATVLGHEMGHILAQHYKDAAEEQAKAQGVSAASSILGSVTDVALSQAGYGGVSGIAGSATEVVTGAIAYGAIVGSFNRTQEYEADHLGLIIMAKAGYNPESALVFWKDAEKVFGTSTTSMGSFFSTHPAYKDRVTALEEAMPYAKKSYKPSVNDIEPVPASSMKKKSKAKKAIPDPVP